MQSRDKTTQRQMTSDMTILSVIICSDNLKTNKYIFLLIEFVLVQIMVLLFMVCRYWVYFTHDNNHLPDTSV
jgi:hypothetical protein